MPKQLNVDLRFNADTSQAKKQIQDLQTSLSQLGQNVNISKSFGGINSELTSALSTVNTLKTQLDRAFNTQTGKLDLTKFTQEMERSGMSLEKYQQSLMKLGPEGSKAFAQLANSIASADIPLMRTNKLLNEMGTVLKNTIKWQLSSSMIHGFMGAIQQAYGYAQDLNESLTNIQIVTSQSSDQMAAFAAQANQAARALSTTTTAYTDAALIFYQQGLDDQAVKERTDATIKMAQVTGDSAQEVSSYMTAIWNNFDDGSESLEHYADIITALGAATASSSAEISQGLEKFASIADTVGLSYEYATTALATVVAQTRQSADVVGTAFKTMFARIQDLELGKTLEDGVDLGQYSKALAKVGVDVMDANGQLRAMDDILDDIGQRWSELGEAERVALAQNVAGQRQYAQFMAIFENWDTFQENLSVANTANGTLQEQADIYAESWEASQKRVKAAMEGIYQSIIDDKFFIKANDFLADNLNGVNNLIKALGGLPGVLSAIGTLLTRYFNIQIANSMRDMAASVMMFTKAGREKVQSQQTQAINLARNQFEEGSIEDQSYGAELEVRKQYLENAEKLNELENEITLTNLKQVEILRQKVIASAELQKAKEQELQDELTRQKITIQSVPGIEKEQIEHLSRLRIEYQDWVDRLHATMGKATTQDLTKFQDMEAALKTGAISLTKIEQEASSLGEKLNLTGEKARQFTAALNSGTKAEFIKNIDLALSKINVELQSGEEVLQQYRSALIEAFDAGGVEDASKKATQMTNNLRNGVMDIQTVSKQTTDTMGQLNTAVRITSEGIKQARGNTLDWASTIVMLSNGLMQFSMILNNIKGIISTIKDENMDVGDKALSILTSLGMTIMMVVRGYQSLSAALAASTLGLQVKTAVQLEELGLTKAEAKEYAKLIVLEGLLNAERKDGITTAQFNTLALKVLGKEAKGLTDDEIRLALSEKLAGEEGEKAGIKMAAGYATALAPLLILVAAIAALVVSYKILEEAYNADAIAAEKAKKNAQELSEAYKNASQSYEELKNTISDYQSARDGLDELTKGTQEFRDALKEANDYASQLIETAHLTSDQYSWENGLLTIDDEVLEQTQQRYLQQMNTAQGAMLIAQNQASIASNQSINTSLARQIIDEQLHGYNDIITNALGPQAASFSDATNWDAYPLITEWGDEIVEGIGNFFGETAADVFAFFDKNELADRARGSGTRFVYGEQQEALEELAEQYQETGRAALLESDLFNSATEEMQTSIEQYCESMQQATEATRLHNQEIAHSILSTEDYTDEIINFAAEDYDEVYQDIYDEVISNSHNFQQWDTEDEEGAAEFFARYAEAAGLAPGIQLEGIVGDVDHRQYTYYDESGELVTRSEEYIASVIASAESMDSLSESAEQASQFLSGLSNQDNAEFYNNLFGNVRDGEVQYEEFLGQYVAANRNSLSGEEILQSLGLDSEELINAYNTAGINVKTIDPIIRQLEEAYGNIQNNFTQYLNEQSIETSKYYHDNSNLQELNFSDAQNILDVYQEAVNNNAEDLFENITDNMSSDTLKQFGDTLSEIDWESITPRQFIQDLKASGFEIEGYEEVLVRFCDSMRTVTADTLAATAEFYNGLQKIADGLSDQSDEISAEDFASLPEDMRQFFALTIDGTYKLLKSARDFQDYVEQSRIAEAIDNRNALYSQYDEARRGMSDTDVGKMQESGYARGAASDEYAQYLAADMAIALHYDDLSELQQAYAEGTVETVEAFNTAAYQIDQAQDTAMLDQEAWQNYSDYIREAGSALEGFNDEMDDFEADIVAKSIMKMNQGVETLSSNFEEWRDILENSTEASAEYADALIGTRKAIAMLLDISEDYVSSDFVTKHLDLIAQAAEGDTEAIDELRVELSQNVNSMLASAVSSTEKDAQKIEGWLNDLTAQALAFDDLEVGASLYLNGKDGFVEALNEMIAATGMTVDQVNALCDSMGFEANFASESQEIKTQIPVYRIHHEVQDEGGKPLGEGQPVPHNWSEITWTEQLPDEEASTYAPAFAMTTDGTTPKINSVTKKPSGSANNLSSSNRGGGKSSGGGGGGKSGSTKKPKDPTGEIERYHVINNQIEDNEKALTRLSKAKDRAYGKARLNAMDAEIAKQRESVELAERKLQEVEEYLKLDSGAIAAFGAEFDANGTIVNYDQLMQEQIDKYNAAVEAYNNSSMDENADAIFQQAEDDYNAFTEALKQYEETQDLWYEQAQAVADAKAEVLQLELEKTNYKVEIGIEWEEEDIARLDFMLKRIEDDAHKAAEAIGLLGERTVDAMDKYNVYQQGFADTLRNLGVGNAEDVIARASAGEDLYGMIGNIVDPNEMAQAVDQMDDYISNMMSSLEDAQESVDQAFEKVKDLFNENVKQMDTYIEKIEFCQKITKSYMNIVDILGKKSLGITNEMLRTFNAESVTQAINNEAAAKAKMDSIQAQLMESQARLAQASGELEQKYWNEIIEEQEKELISATENFHQAWEDALQANLEAFENNIELVIEDFSNAVGDLNAMKAEWDLQKSLTDMWEPEYERWHQLSDLINDINKSVDENENLKYKQDLLDLETEIEQLQEEEAQLSEYDLNYLRLRYEAKLAEIALEEAQNAKSQVKMSRDNEGNYSYVYTADEDAVNNAADDYRNKIYEMEKANEEYIDTLQEQLLDMHDKMLEDIKEAGDLYGIGTEAYFEAVDRIEQTYLGQSQFIQAQMQNVFDNNQRLRDEDIIQYVAYTGDIAAQNVDLQLSFADTYMGIQTQSDDLNTYFNDTWIPALETTFDNAREVTDHYVETNEAAMETAGTTMDEFSARATQDMAMATAQTEELARQTKNYGDTAVRAFAQAAQAWQTGPGSMLNAIESQATAIANLAQQYTSLKSQLDAATASAIALAHAMNQPVSSSPSSVGGAAAGGGSGGPGGNNPSSNPNGGLGTKDTLTNNTVKDTLTNNTVKDTMTKDTYGKGALVQAGKSATSSNFGNGNLLKKILQFASGGYTGEWNDEPRWALLDQKELVLNTKDTMNILSAVDVVRQLANSIDLNTMSANIAGASIKSASGTPGTIEQRVEITASFPNATDRNEIEQAFQNLVNHASQYANRKD